jgi:hypothetical protein
MTGARSGILLTLAMVLGACTTRAGPTTSSGCANDAFRAIRDSGESPREVTICGTVLRVSRAAHTRSGVHEYIDVRVPGSDPLLPIEVVVNESEEGPVPAHAGDQILVHGRYFNDGNRDGIDWTHHGASHAWPYAGYIVVNGRRYQ